MEEVDRKRADEVLSQLKSWLRTGNSDAVNLANTEAPLLRVILKQPLADQVLQLIASFSLAEALALIEDHEKKDRPNDNL